MKKIILLSLLAATAFVSCKEEEPEPAQDQITFKGTDYPLLTSFIENYGLLQGNQSNLDLTITGNGNTEAYFEISCSDSTQLPAGTYTFDENWGPNTFDIGTFILNNGSTSQEFNTSSGSLVVENNAKTTINCTFSCQVYNEDSTVTGTLTGVYDGSTVVSGFVGELNELKGKEVN